ncbi:hypothetical protein PRIPAC_81030, partial [Pristionchus pacificus]
KRSTRHSCLSACVVVISSMGLFGSVFLFFLFIGGTQAFVFSCEEVLNKLINSNLQEPTQYVCLVTQEGFTNEEALKDIYVQNDKVSTSFYTMWKEMPCVARPGSAPWRVVADLPLSLDCTQEFSLIFTSVPGDIFPVYDHENWLKAGVNALYVAPKTGIVLHKDTCEGDGQLNVYTGAGKGVGEFRFHLKSWSCADFPDWIISFENVITILPDAGVSYSVYYRTHDHTTGIDVSPSDHVAVMSSGYSDNLQNLFQERNVVVFNEKEDVEVTVNRTASFDDRYQGSVIVDYTNAGEGLEWFETIHNETGGSTTTVAQRVQVEYHTIPFAPQDIWDSYDHFVVELFFTALEKPTTAAPTIDADPYCGCALDKKFGMPDGWESTKIWLDVVIILDTSEAMGAVALTDASSLIESFIGTDDGDVLVTDKTATFYTRVGLIAMSDKPQVLYNLNMTKADKVVGKVQINSGVSYLDVVEAFNAAVQMLNDGMQEDRAYTRQVIYYMTDTDPKFDSRVLDSFKASRGKIIVNNFLEPNEVERPGLKELASPGYYYSNIQYNYMSTVQLFCKANCFCRPDIDRFPYPGHNTDPALLASGGCYRAVPAGVPFSKMRGNCEGGLIASIHDADKANFVAQQFTIAAPNSDYFWIGYSRGDAGWAWEDKSTNPYTNWDKANGEPSTASVAKCAYVDTTTPNLFWGAGNCNVGFPSVCEYAPCEVGNKDC